MQLFNKKLLNQHIARYSFPQGEDLEKIQALINGWQKALKDSDLDRTKETSIQGQFLTKFFETILGYSTHTSGKSQWHLVQEPKTDVDSQEADGALGFFTKDTQKVDAVIELKDARTSLDKKQSGRVGKLTPVEQAFNYLNKFDGCQWAIVSNFHEIRIYSKSRGQGFYEKFDITELDKEEEFKRFYFLLNKTNLIDDGQISVVEELVKNTTIQEENITKQFYAQYKDIRLKLLNHLFECNKQIDRLVLVEKTQKLLDRLIFTLVCEDSSTLLPAHLVQNTYDRATNSFSPSDERVWSEFKGLFHAIDEGNSRVIPPINAYNGGLFKKDEILDNLIIKDDIWSDLIALTKYDFESDLNVNILGHIFEQSISDLEELRQSVFLALEQGGNLLTQDGNKIEIGTQTRLVEKTGIGKRKRQGIFYTPEYITKFIVENTVGKYLEEHPDKLETIKILDPACGSGAFLNQAHSFLLNEYKVRTEQLQLEKRQRGEAITLWDMNYAENNKAILLNNLFGVDLSPESVEITKLALWLKTASSTEPLQNLDNNIKCGNSLVDNEQIAGKYAFKWSHEFTSILSDGGFDVIIGNPPYVYAREKISAEEKEYYNSQYVSAEYQLNTFVLFIEKSIRLLKSGGYLGLIVPNSLLKIGSISKLREFVLKSTGIKSIINLSGYSFDKVNVETVIIILQKDTETNDVEVKNISSSDDISTNNGYLIEGGKWKENKTFDFDIFITKDDEVIINKISQKSSQLGALFEVRAGLQAYEKGKGNPIQTESDVKNRPYDFKSQIDSSTYQYIEGKDISRNRINGFSYWLKYGANLAAPRTLDIFTRPRVLIREIANSPPYCFHAVFTEKTILNNRSIINVIHPNDDMRKLKYLVGFINTRLVSWYFTKTNPKANRSMFPKLILRDLEKFPVYNPDSQQEGEIGIIVDKLLILNKKLLNESQRLLEILMTEYSLKSTNNLSNFYLLGWNEFIVELNKQNKQDLSAQDRLNKWFNKSRSYLLSIKKEIDFLDNEIDKKVYGFYNLTNEEINVIEKY